MVKIPVSRATRTAMTEWPELATRVPMGVSPLEAVKLNPLVVNGLPEYSGAEVDLIRSIPQEAFARIHKLTIEAVTSGEDRTEEIKVELLRTMEITLNRATMIANTETSRTASVLVQKQSELYDIPEYFWRTQRDDRVRHAHKPMEGVVCRWDSPPVLIDGTVGHAGRFPNCRCWAEPVIRRRRG